MTSPRSVDVDIDNKRHDHIEIQRQRKEHIQQVTTIDPDSNTVSVSQNITSVEYIEIDRTTRTQTHITISENEPNETTRLLPQSTPPKKEGWLSWAEKWSTRAIAGITAMPNFINSALSGLGIKAQDLSADTINNAPVDKQLFAGTLGSASFIANFLIGIDYIPKAFKDLFSKANWVKHPIRTSVSTLGGLTGMLSLSAIAFESGAALPALAFAMVVLGAPALFATRSKSVNGALTRAANKFNGNFKAQEDYIKALDCLHEEYKKEIQTALENAAKNFTADQRKENPSAFYEKLFETLEAKLEALKKLHPDESLVDQEKMNQETSKPAYTHYAGTLFKLSAFTIGAFYAYLLFAQKGLDSLKIIDSWLYTNSTTFDDWSQTDEMLAGSVFGLPSAATYGLNAYDFVNYLMAACSPLSARNSRQAPTMLLLTAISTIAVLSASSTLNVATTVANRVSSTYKSIIDMSPDTYRWMLASLAGIINFNSGVNQAIITKPPVDITEDPTLESLAKFFSHASGPGSHPLPEKTIEALRKQSFFSLPTPSSSTSRAPEDALNVITLDKPTTPTR